MKNITTTNPTTGFIHIKPRDGRKRMVLREKKELAKNRGEWQQRVGYCGCNVDG